MRTIAHKLPAKQDARVLLINNIRKEKQKNVILWLVINYTLERQQSTKMLGKPLLQRAHMGTMDSECIQRIRLHATSSANPIYRQASPHSTCVLPSIGMSLRRTREGEGGV